MGVAGLDTTWLVRGCDLCSSWTQWGGMPGAMTVFIDVSHMVQASRQITQRTSSTHQFVLCSRQGEKRGATLRAFIGLSQARDLMRRHRMPWSCCAGGLCLGTVAAPAVASTPAATESRRLDAMGGKLLVLRFRPVTAAACSRCFLAHGCAPPLHLHSGCWGRSVGSAQ